MSSLGNEWLRSENRGAKVPHKCFRAQGSQISFNDLRNKGERCNIGSHSHGQHESLFILLKMGDTKTRS